MYHPLTARSNIQSLQEKNWYSVSIEIIFIHHIVKTVQQIEMEQKNEVFELFLIQKLATNVQLRMTT